MRRELAEERAKAETSRAQEAKKYPAWYKAAAELDEMLQWPRSWQRAQSEGTESGASSA